MDLFKTARNNEDKVFFFKINMEISCASTGCAIIKMLTLCYFKSFYTKGCKKFQQFSL